MVVENFEKKRVVSAIGQGFLLGMVIKSDEERVKPCYVNDLSVTLGATAPNI